MINGDYYLNLHGQELKDFTDLTEILPIDDKISYKGNVYQLTNSHMQVLNLTRNSLGYPNEYSGPERNPGDPNKINMMDFNKISTFIKNMEYDIEHGFEPEFKKIN